MIGEGIGAGTAAESAAGGTGMTSIAGGMMTGAGMPGGTGAITRGGGTSGMTGVESAGTGAEAAAGTGGGRVQTGKRCRLEGGGRLSLNGAAGAIAIEMRHKA